MTTGSAAIRFLVLGPVQAVRNGSTLPLGGPRQRALLALLLLDAGRSVGADHLVDELWHGQPPAGAAETLRTYVSRLRATLGPHAVIQRSPSGYVLDVSSDQIDARRFERLAREGREALGRGAARRAAERLRAALALWRGRPFADVGEEGALRDEAERLEQLRLQALENRIEADLALGLDAELVDELEGLVHEHPFRERLWQQLMLALYRAQRQADALAAYQRARAILDEELGLEPSEELRQLEQAILRHDIPAVRQPTEQHNLPAPLTSFVGRERELFDLDRLLGEARLVTLTGVGGAGKTRLALETAMRAVSGSPDGVFFVDLAPLPDHGLVASRVAGVLEVPEQPDTTVELQLSARLRGADLLLVLDNCEHVRAACADLAVSLLATCPSLRLLATSRETLGVPGEVDYPVPPLGLPSPEADTDALRASEAVRLFLARAADARPHLPDDERALASAGRIVRDLDGLPLALELAAARAKMLSLDEIAEGLADRFRFLVSWRRLTAARHRTLQEAMDWSYDLLTDEERVFLASLSVFSGTFPRAAAAAVSLDEPDRERALALLGRLVDVSLVVAEEHGGEMRYRLLETVRQYAAARLDELGAASELRRRHANYYSGFVERAWIEWQFVDLDRYARLFEPDLDNLRSVLEWSREVGDGDRSLRLARGLWQVWWVLGLSNEGRAWLEDTLASAADADPIVRSEVLEGAAGLAWTQSDLDRAAELADEALPIFAEHGDVRGEHACVTILGHVAHERGDYPGAVSLFERSRDLAPAMDGRVGKINVALAHHNLGSVALSTGDLNRAVELYDAALSLYRAVDDDVGVALSELFLGLVAAMAGRPDDAAGRLCAALRFYRRMRFRHYTTVCLEAIALVAHGRGDDADATRFLSAAAGSRERLGNLPGGVTPAGREDVLAGAAARLGDARFAEAWEEGRSLAEDELLDRAERAVAA